MTKQLTTAKHPKKYKVIVNYQPNGDIAEIDSTPGLQVHLVSEEKFNELPTIHPARMSSLSEPYTTFNWGPPLHEKLEIRHPTVTVGNMLLYGNFGVGRIGKGGAEEKSDFVDDGEVLFIPCDKGVKVCRVKGEEVFSAQVDDKCWTGQIANDGVANVQGIKEPKTFSNRSELLKFLREVTGVDKDMPFIAHFDACFEPTENEVSVEDSFFEGDKKSSLTMLKGSLEILKIHEQYIATTADSPNKFREPLLKTELSSALEAESPKHKPVVIIGGGMAGTLTALKLAGLGIPCTIIEQKDQLLSGTSGCTPGRVGHGYHYRDLETAILYLQSSIAFIKKYCKTPEDRERFVRSINRDDPNANPNINFGLYFIHKDSQVPAEELLKIYDGIREEYKRLVELDPSNKVFGEPENFLEELNLEDFKDIVDISQMAAVIRTKEELLHWPEFSQYLLDEVERYKENGLISVMNNTEVETISHEEGNKRIIIKTKDTQTKVTEEIITSYGVGATWHNNEKLGASIFPEAAVEDRSNRLKIIVSIDLPEAAWNLPSMFICMGAFAMFSNEGNGKGKITFAPVTNFREYIIAEFQKTDPATFDLELRKLWKEWIAKKEIVVSNTDDIGDWKARPRFNPEEFNKLEGEALVKALKSEDLSIWDDPQSWQNMERQLDIPPLYKRWIGEGLNEQEDLNDREDLGEVEYFGQKILEGVVKTFTVLQGAKITNVAGGIVKSEGQVSINDANSAVHKRSGEGIESHGLWFISFDGTKLFYTERESRIAIQELIDHITMSIIFEKEDTRTDAEREMGDKLKESILNYARWRHSSLKTPKSLLGLHLPETPLQNEISDLKQSLSDMFNLYLNHPEVIKMKDVSSDPIKQIIVPIVDTVKSVIEDRGNCENKIKSWQESTIENLKKFPDLFTIFSMIDLEGNIIFDGKHGTITPEKRKELAKEIEKEEITLSLAGRDYVQKILKDNKDHEFVCGAPVFGSTSGKYMIPVGIKMGENILTFGIDLAKLLLVTRQKTAKVYHLESKENPDLKMVTV